MFWNFILRKTCQFEFGVGKKYSRQKVMGKDRKNVFSCTRTFDVLGLLHSISFQLIGACIERREASCCSLSLPPSSISRRRRRFPQKNSREKSDDCEKYIRTASIHTYVSFPTCYFSISVRCDILLPSIPLSAAAQDRIVVPLKKWKFLFKNGKNALPPNPPFPKQLINPRLLNGGGGKIKAVGRFMSRHFLFFMAPTLLRLW